MIPDIDAPLARAREIAENVFNDAFPADLTQFEGLMVGATLAGVALGLMAKHGAIEPGKSEDLIASSANIMRITAEQVAMS